MGGGDVVGDAVDDTEDSAVDSDDETIPEDLHVDYRRHALLGKSRSAHVRDEALDDGALDDVALGVSRSAGDVRHREA